MSPEQSERAELVFDQEPDVTSSNQPARALGYDGGYVLMSASPVDRIQDRGEKRGELNDLSIRSTDQRRRLPMTGALERAEELHAVGPRRWCSRIRLG